MFLERHPGYYDDGLIVDDDNQSYSEPDEIAHPKGSRTNSKNDTCSLWSPLICMFLHLLHRSKKSKPHKNLLTILFESLAVN